MGSDAPPQHFATPQGMTVSLNVEAARSAAHLQRAGRRRQGLDAVRKTFWSAGFGMADRSVRHALDDQRAQA